MPAARPAASPQAIMRYQSTRGTAPTLDFRDATLAGLASDGGLYVPEVWPTLSRQDIADLAGLSYAETAARIMTPFVGDAENPAASGAAVTVKADVR